MATRSAQPGAEADRKESRPSAQLFVSPITEDRMEYVIVTILALVIVGNVEVVLPARGAGNERDIVNQQVLEVYQASK